LFGLAYLQNKFSTQRAKKQDYTSKIYINIHLTGASGCPWTRPVAKEGKNEARSTPPPNLGTHLLASFTSCPQKGLFVVSDSIPLTRGGSRNFWWGGDES